MAGATALLSGSHKDILSVNNHGMTLPKSQLIGPDNGESKAQDTAPTIVAENENLPGQASETTIDQDTDIRVLPHSIAQVEVVLNNFKDSAFFLFSRQFCPNVVFPPSCKWTVGELFASVPDLRDDFAACYPDALPMTIPVEVVRRRKLVCDRLRLADFNLHSDPMGLLSAMPEMRQAYLQPQPTNDNQHIVLRPKPMNSIDVGIYSVFGGKFLPLPHRKDNKNVTPSPLMVMFIGLFALGYLSRYYPQLWNPFVRTDETGERMVVERFLSICSRYVPNLVLNHIHDERLHFTPPAGLVSQAALDEEEIKRIIQEQIVEKLGRDGKL